MKKAVVVGAGVSGLSAAHRLLELQPEIDLTVLEGSDRAGGLIKTEHIDGFLVEQGPDSILTEKPQALELAKRLGIEDQVLPTNTQDRGAYVLAHGKLERIPEGFSMMAPTQALPILTSHILSPRGKLRLMAEVFLPRGTPTDDESIAHFVRRRFGEEVLVRLAQPLMSGIYGSDPEDLSLASTMPRFIDFERQHRSVTLGMLRKKKKANQASGVRYGLFMSFKNGVQTLTDALHRAVGERVQLNAKVSRIDKHDGAYRVHVDGREPIDADAVILALPARASSGLVRALDPELGESLAEIEFGSTATVAYAWPRSAVRHPLDAFGFVVPTAENRKILASTWASKKFAGRAPDGHVLLRAFFGGDHGTQTLELSDDELIELGIQELDALLGIEGRPLFATVGRQSNAMPKYAVGHAARVERCEARLHGLPGMVIAGNSLYGVGIPDAIGAGERGAERILAS